MKPTILFIIALSITFLSYSQPNPEMKDILSMTFKPDYFFKGAELQGWQTLGKGKWKAENGEIQGTSNDETGTMLVMDKPYQDIGLQVSFKTLEEVETGFIFRIEEKGSDREGILISVTKDEVVPYQITFGTEGEIMKRNRLRYAGGIFYRVAPPKEAVNTRMVGEGNSLPPRPDPEVEVPLSRPDSKFSLGTWNQVEIFLDANLIRTFLNNGRETGGAIDGEDAFSGYGPIAFYIGGAGTVNFKNIMLKDISKRTTPIEASSSRFEVQRISDMYYSWGADAADFNQDGHLDVVAGPYIYYGPEFTQHREIFPAISVSPSKEFTSTNVQFTYDFNGDGWPDVLTSPSRAVLFINPKGAPRRWESFNILPAVQSESTDFVDLDKDGKPELVYGADGTLRYAKPQEGDPTLPWLEFIISEKGYALAHGIGTGDINGDGRLDILNPHGWWEQPEELGEDKQWTYHPVSFAHFGRSGGTGGSLMAVYDVNGNGLNDVVTNLNVHGFGLAWFEQKRNEKGEISFEKHMISNDYSTENAGGVTFSQAHGSAFADVDGDGVSDFIVGKRYFTHLDNQYDPDPYGPPVIYWYKTVRNPDAPGGAEFVPELIHNRSGAGSEITVKDLNNSGAPDIITSTNRGTFIYWNQGE